jgi:gliding motility-associated-like protein
MKIRLLLFIFSLGACAQEYNIWHFGSEAGLDFNQGAPVLLDGGKTLTIEGTATISDANGNLLFYTDGVRVWNKNHAFMQNGTGLKGHSSSAQSALIIPKPGSTTIYYIFTTTAMAGADGLCYSVVDMEAAGGLGAVLDKNVLLHTPTCEKVAAAWHINGTDIWVLSHEYGTNVFAAYLVTDAGVNPTPVNSSTGVAIGLSSNQGAGYIRFSPEGERLVMTSHGNTTQLFDFDPQTGTVQNPVSLGQNNYGSEFSASGNILYVTAQDLQTSKVYQYNLQAANIMGTATELFTVPQLGMHVGALQRGPDNKIYVARSSGSTSLSVIMQPDIAGTGCGFTDNGISLVGPGIGGHSWSGLPNNSLAPAYRVVINRQLSCLGQESHFWVTSPQAAPDTVLWDFGDGGSSTQATASHIYLSPGTYTVKLTATGQGVTRVVQTTVEIINAIPIGQPAALVACEEGEGVAKFNLTTQNTSVLGGLDANNYSITYHATAQQAEAGTNALPADYTNISNPQTLYARLEAVNAGCYATTSFNLIVNPKPVIVMPDSVVVCPGSTTVLEAPEGFESYRWSTGQSGRMIIVNTTGTYTLTVAVTVNGMWCENSKTITVYESAPPVIRKVETTDWTTDENTITVLVSGNGNYEYSINGSTYQDSPQFNGLQSGIYTVYVRDKEGCGSDSEDVTLLMHPKFFTPNGDGVNDFWHILYSWKEPTLVVHILDRYGKYIATINAGNPRWDGKSNGQDLPATDYWFVAERQDGRRYRGHFAMIR